MSAKLESPDQEMRRLIRSIAGRQRSGEKDQQMMARAARRMNAGLSSARQIGPRRAKSYWYAEVADIPSDHMDRARELEFILPLQEAHDAVQTAEAFLATLRERLFDRALGAAGDDSGDRAARGREGSPHGAGRDDLGGDAPQSGLSPAALRLISNSCNTGS